MEQYSLSQQMAIEISRVSDTSYWRGFYNGIQYTFVCMIGSVGFGFVAMKLFQAFTDNVDSPRFGQRKQSD